MNVFDGFVIDGMPKMYDRCTIYIGKDGSCIKSVLQDDKIAVMRLHDEYLILKKIQEESFPPRLIAYDEANSKLRMEYIQGLELDEYVLQYGKIPNSYAKDYVNIQLRLLDFGVYYVDLKQEHFIFDDTGKLRLIDYGVCDLLNNSEAINYAKTTVKRQYAFVYNETKDDKESKDEFEQDLLSQGIGESIIQAFFDNMDYL